MDSKRKSSVDNGDGEESPTRAGGSKRRRQRGETLHGFMKKLKPGDRQVVQELIQKYGFNVPQLSSRKRKYRLKFKTELPNTLFTDRIFRADNIVIEIVLVDTLNNVITIGPMATSEIELVVLDGNLNVDEQSEWTEEEFMNYILKPREGKGPLLIGNLSTRLCNGIGRISDAKFTDNSSWTNKFKSFRLGVRGMAKEVQEGISNAFRVKDRHVKRYQKDRLLSMNDEVCCLKGIFKNGPVHKKLVECKINTVQDFLYYCNKNDPEMLRAMIGMTKGRWETTYGHASEFREPSREPFRELHQKYRVNVPHSSSRKRKYRLQFKNRLPNTLFTDTIFRADNIVIEIVLVDASNNVITTGPMATSEIEIVVLDGDLNVDEHGEWTEEEFMNYILKPREGKGPLLIGNLSTRLCNGIGRISDAKFTDNSSWANKFRSFRLGVRGMAKEVQEGISNLFRVKDRHVKRYQKDRLLSMNDEVCYLKGIFKNGPFHKKLVECKINTVRDFLCYCSKNGPETLRAMIGMTKGRWETTYGHASEFREPSNIVLDGRLYNPPAPDQNFFELTGSSSSQPSNVLVQPNGLGMFTSAQGLTAPISFEPGKTTFIISAGIWSGTNRLDVPYEDLLEKNGSYVSNNFGIGSPLLREKWLMLLFIARLKIATPRLRESKYSETSSQRENDGELLYGDHSPILYLTP